MFDEIYCCCYCCLKDYSEMGILSHVAFMHRESGLRFCLECPDFVDLIIMDKDLEGDDEMFYGTHFIILKRMDESVIVCTCHGNAMGKTPGRFSFVSRKIRLFLANCDISTISGCFLLFLRRNVFKCIHPNMHVIITIVIFNSI